MSGEGGGPTRFVDKIVGICLSVLLAAMAIYGAVRIVSAVFVPLCIGITALAAIVGVWFLIRRRQGW